MNDLSGTKVLHYARVEIENATTLMHDIPGDIIQSQKCNEICCHTDSLTNILIYFDKHLFQKYLI